MEAFANGGSYMEELQGIDSQVSYFRPWAKADFGWGALMQSRGRRRRRRWWQQRRVVAAAAESGVSKYLFKATVEMAGKDMDCWWNRNQKGTIHLKLKKRVWVSNMGAYFVFW